jgi:hypothetical protein
MGLVWAIAVWAVAEGLLKIMLAFKARSFRAAHAAGGAAASA